MAAVKKPAPKLVTFIYECKNAQGSKVSGEIAAANIALAKADLRRQGLNPIKIRKSSSAFFAKFNKKKVTTTDVCHLSRQMATMMSAGVPLVQSFDIVAKSTENESVRDLILSIKADVEAGRAFSEALRQHPMEFDNLFCNLVAAGESSGSLETMLDRIAIYKEKSETLKKKIKKALFYPCAVVIVAIIVCAILLIFVVPQFEHLFKSFGAELPMFTKAIIHLSNVVQKWWWLVLIALTGLIWGFNYARKKFIAVEYALDKIMLKIPVIGDILNKAVVARYARTLSTTFAAGVPLVEALESVAGATGNKIFQDAVNRIREEVSTGSQMQAAMRNTNVFPNAVIQMVAIGEESGSLDKMLSKVASIYEEEVDAAVEGLSTLLEPLIMAVLGVMVGCLVIAMYLPIFKMGSIM